MSFRTLIALLLLASTLVASGCDIFQSDDTRTPPIGTFEVIVRGTVTEADGTVARDVGVRARGYVEACAERPPDGQQGINYLTSEGRTSETGTFEIDLVRPEPGTIRCLNVQVDRTGFVDGEPREADTTVARSAELRTPQAGEEVEVLTLDVQLD
jgi:hypothetical protein